MIGEAVIDHESVKRYPLEWPIGWKRTPAAQRVPSRFSTKRQGEYKRELSLTDAIERLELQLDRLASKSVTLSTSVSLTLRGMPRSDERPNDPGAAVYFSFRGKATVIACDKYTSVAGNIGAMAAHLEAIRAIERYGVGTIEQALAGYKALPADTAANWRAVFGFAAESTPTIEQVDSAYKATAKNHHPDLGGTDIDMAHINRARDYALMEFKETE